MAKEIQVSASLTFAKAPITGKTFSVANINANVAGSNYELISQTIPTTPGGTALSLGPLATVGWMILVNMDTTNFVQVLTGISGTTFGKILPGEPFLMRLDPTITAPALKADTASVQIQGLIVEI